MEIEMRKHVGRIFLLGISLVVWLTLGSVLFAQDVTGNWQGTLSHEGRTIRLGMKISKTENGSWSAIVYRLDAGRPGTPAASFTVQGSTIMWTLEDPLCSYEGNLNADGNSIVGNWTDENDHNVLPLNFQRAAKDTAPQFDSSISLPVSMSGDWQGESHPDQEERRLELKISKTDNAGWSVMLYSVQQWPKGISVPTVMLQDSTFTFSVKYNGFPYTYEGKLSADGNSITGTFAHEQNSWPVTFQRATKGTAWSLDSSAHTVQFVTVAPDVNLEVLDWGGVGRPVIFLAGLGLTAHIFDTFAPKLTAHYHVYGITRRGFGASSVPAPDYMNLNGNYLADRLGDDVLAVLDALKIDRPVLAGHSIAGEELSSVCSRYPERVAGLIYLDAGYPYAHYDHSLKDFVTDIDRDVVSRKLFLISPESGVHDRKQMAEELLQTDLPAFEDDLRRIQKMQQASEDQDDFRKIQRTPQAPRPITPREAVFDGMEKYTEIKCPVLAIFAVPHDYEPDYRGDPAHREIAVAADRVRMTAIADSFQSGVPSARVVRLPNANHGVWSSNEADVLGEINAFLGSLR
jgi:pimeloyl-ACP methyl ester carboxylesterase